MGFVDLFPSTRDRVKINTAPEVNERLRQQAEASVKRYENAGDMEIEDRLDQLDQEWDIERVIEANASVAVLIGLALGFLVNRKFFFFPFVVASFLLHHALRGWCPPVVPWRHAGVRTHAEIFEEKTALRLLRGDLKPTNNADEALAQARAA